MSAREPIATVQTIAGTAVAPRRAEPILALFSGASQSFNSVPGTVPGTWFPRFPLLKEGTAIGNFGECNREALAEPESAMSPTIGVAVRHDGSDRCAIGARAIGNLAFSVGRANRIVPRLESAHGSIEKTQGWRRDRTPRKAGA